MSSEKPVIHGRDHRHGGADPLLIPYEDVAKNVKDTPGTFSKIKWGDMLTATDEGAGVVRIDGVFTGGPGYKETAQTLDLVGYWSFQQSGVGGDDVLNNEAEGASGYLGWVQGEFNGATDLFDADYGEVGPGGELSLAGRLHAGAHNVVNTSGIDRTDGSWGAQPPADGTDSISGVIAGLAGVGAPDYTWAGWVYMEDKQWSSAAPIWHSRGVARLLINTLDSDADVDGDFPLDSRATSDQWVLSFYRGSSPVVETSPIPSNQWVFLVVSVGVDAVTIYANAAPVASADGTGGAGAPTVSHSFDLGYAIATVGGFDSWAYYFAGSMAGVCFFLEALTADQVSALYDSIINAHGQDGQVLSADEDGNVKWTWPQQVTVDGA